MAKRSDLTYADLLEVAARRGLRPARARRHRRRRGQPRGRPGNCGARCRAPTTRTTWRWLLYLGEVAHRRFLAAPLRTDGSLRADLDAKEALGLRAYDLWRTALDFREPYWATASGYMMSQVFYEFWLATVRAPFPSVVAPEERAAYVVEVHDRVADRLHKALEGHKMNVELGRAYGVKSYWSDESAARVVELLGVLDAEARGNLITPDGALATN
ncbi:MAG: hypothetical protein R2939_13870 [Kofleriaceae bacterium]